MQKRNNVWLKTLSGVTLRLNPSGMNKALFWHIFRPQWRLTYCVWKAINRASNRCRTLQGLVRAASNLFWQDSWKFQLRSLLYPFVNTPVIVLYMVLGLCTYMKRLRYFIQWLGQTSRVKSGFTGNLHNDVLSQMYVAKRNIFGHKDSFS